MTKIAYIDKTIFDKIYSIIEWKYWACKKSCEPNQVILKKVLNNGF